VRDVIEKVHHAGYISHPGVFAERLREMPGKEQGK